MSFNLANMWSSRKKKNIVKKNQNMGIKFNQNKLVIKKRGPIVKQGDGRGTKGFWGTPTWYLFHSLAGKADPEKYKKHYIVVWNFIKEICNGLPCPYCKQHASNYVNRIPVYNINTKDKLIKILFNFHNDVNVRTGKMRVGEDVLKKYKSANLNKILELFYSRFFVSYIGRRHFDDWIKNKTKESTDKFWIFYKNNLL